MYSKAIYAWGWLQHIAQTKEQTFSRSIEPMDSTKKEDHHKPYEHLWSFSDLVLVTITFQLDMIYLCDMGFMLKTDRNPGFLQIMVMYATWGPALIYMEIFLGQYVRHGCLYLKNMSPLTCSTIGYAMLMTMYFYSVASVGRLADSYMFFFRSFSSELPWMVCPKGSNPETCIDRALLVACYLENRQDNCYPKLEPDLLSSRIYYKSMHSTFANKTGLLLLGWLTIYVALKRTLSDTRVIVKRLLLFILVLFMCLLATLVVHVGRGLKVVPFFSLNQGAVFTLGTWVAAFQSFLREHSAVRGGWQLIGCHIKPGPVAANLTIYSCGITYLITVFSHIFSTGILGVLIFYMKVTRPEEELYFPKYTKLFNFYPFALGMLQVRQVWSLIFFTLVALVSLAYTVVNLAVLEESVYDEFPILLRYRGYVKVILCIVGFFIGVVTNLLTAPNSYKDDISLQIGYRLTTIVVLVVTFSVGYIYGMERFADDMNFLNGSQPTTYWKICWKTLPFGILVLIGRDMIINKFPRDDLAHMTSNIIYAILLGLAVLRLIYQIVMSIKARNVAGMLFQATPLWGPPLQEDRRLRNTYNPRKETKYWRKNHLCTHHCLLNKDFILSIIFREIDSRTSKAQKHDTLQSDFAAERKQITDNQVVIAIDKVSSAQLETFEEQVKQKMKLLEQMEKPKVKLDQKQTISAGTRVTATRSIEELDYRIERMIEQAERKAELEKGKNLTRTRQRRLPTFMPKETPRPKKLSKGAAPADPKDKTDKGPANVHTYTVQVPHFVLKPPGKIVQDSAAPSRSEKREDLGAAKPSPVRGILCSKSTTCRASQRHSSLKAKLVVRKPRLPVWPLPLDTPRPTVSPRLSRSSSSTSTESREACCQQSDYFLNARLPPKANLPLPAFSIDIHSPPGDSGSPGSSAASSELFALNNDPVLREILGSVRPELRPVLHRTAVRVSSRIGIDRDNRRSERREIFRPQPEPRTSIARRSPPIGSPAASPRPPLPLPRKRKSKDAPIPSPRPRKIETKPLASESDSEEETVWFDVEKRIIDSMMRREDQRITEQKTQRTGEVAVDIDRAIQIRIDKLLRGVREPGQSTDQQPGCSSAVSKAKTMSEAVKRHCKSSKFDDQGKGTSQDPLSLSKTKKKLGNQPRATSSVAAKISALGKRFAARMRRGSTSPRVARVPKDENENRSETSVKEELILNPEQSTSSLTNKMESCDKEE